MRLAFFAEVLDSIKFSASYSTEMQYETQLAIKLMGHDEGRFLTEQENTNKSVYAAFFSKKSELH